MELENNGKAAPLCLPPSQVQLHILLAIKYPTVNFCPRSMKEEKLEV